MGPIFQYSIVLNTPMLFSVVFSSAAVIQKKLENSPHSLCIACSCNGAQNKLDYAERQTTLVGFGTSFNFLGMFLVHISSTDTQLFKD